MLNPPDQIAERFRIFSREVFTSWSPLYEVISRNIAEDKDMLDLAAWTPRDQPVPNMILAAVHYLLLRGVDHSLRKYYLTLTPDPADPADAYEPFRAFCMEHIDEIKQLLQTRRVQTNEVRRCTLTVPVFGEIALQTGQPLALIEIGPSAGLNLLWDHYAFRYSNGARTGHENSTVVLECELRGDHAPQIPTPLPRVASRIGIDIFPVYPGDEDATLWLRALIWPEHIERFNRLDNALQIASEFPPTLRKGDALALLPEAINAAPAGAAVSVYHSFAVNQFSPDMRRELDTILSESSKQRRIDRIWLEWESKHAGSVLRHIMYQDGEANNQMRALCHPHGEYMTWVDPAAT